MKPATTRTYTAAECEIREAEIEEPSRPAASVRFMTSTGLV